MRTLKKTGVTVLTAGIALAIGAVPVAFTVPSILASSETTTTLAPGAEAVEQIVLSTDSETGTVRWRDDVQSFSGGQQCKIAMDSSTPSVLAITGTIEDSEGNLREGAAGFRDGDIGVFEISESESGNPDSASQCFRVDADSFTKFESLTLALHPDGDFSDVYSPTVPLRANLATVDARAKSQRGSIEVTFVDGTGAEIKIGDSATPYTKTVSWGTSRKAKSGDPINVGNLALPEGQLFTGVRLTATSGSFSLRGAKLDLKSQLDKTLTCSDPSWTDPEANFSVTYVGKYTETECKGEIGVALGIENEEQVKTFRMPKTAATLPAQFIFEIPWDTASTDDPTYLPYAQIDFEIDTGFRNMEFCPDYLFDSSGNLVGLFDDDLGYDASLADLVDRRDMEDSDDGIQFACIGNRTSEAKKIADGKGFDLTIVDQIYLVGDARMRL